MKIEIPSLKQANESILRIQSLEIALIGSVFVCECSLEYAWLMLLGENPDDEAEEWLCSLEDKYGEQRIRVK